MSRVSSIRLLLALGVVAVMFTTGAGRLNAETLADFNARLSAVKPEVAAALANPSEAGAVVDKLDRDEATFADLTANSRASRAQLRLAYERLEAMLEQVYTTYRRRHEACLKTIGNGGKCDYSTPEQLELRSLYPLSWLRFHGAVLYNDQPSVQRRMLEHAISGFTQSMLILISPDLIRENLLGRAYCERDLGKFDHSRYAKAIADFKKIMKAGPKSAQYRAAEQGLATTYAAMGETGKAAALTQRLAQSAGGSEKESAELFQLQELLKAESAANDPAKRADYHAQIVSVLKQIAQGKKGWNTAVGAVSSEMRNPRAELGGSNDPFINYLLGLVLYARHRPLPAAKYYLRAARAGGYPQAYRYAVEIYYAERRYDLMDPVLAGLARRRDSLGEWAGYMRFKVARERWQRGGEHDQRLRSQWIRYAHDYLSRYPKGRFAYEPRFRLGELLQQQKRYPQAIAQFEWVRGDPFYVFAATFNAAQCRYLIAVKAWNAPHATQPPKGLIDAAEKGFAETIAAAPGLEKRHGQKSAYIRDSAGRASFMLAAILEHAPHPDYTRIARVLDGYEGSYPQLDTYFAQVVRWRLQALDHLREYAAAQRQIASLVAPGKTDVSSNFIKTVGLDFWSERTARLAAGDHAGALADARLTALTYAYFERAVKAGTVPAADLTGTLSILGQAYAEQGEDGRARAIFEQVLDSAPNSPDAAAGLARLAQQNKDYKKAAELWSRVETNAAESDILWFEARYNLALIYAHDGNVGAACGKLAITRSEHPSLDSPLMKARWDRLQRRICLRH